MPAAAAPAAPLMVLGDSLSAEYGLRRGSGWVALLEARLSREKLARPVVNASISGETTAGGRSRIGGLLARHQPSVLIVELGANDALRGLDLKSTEANLRAIAQAGRDAGAKVLLVGMMLPPNYGRAFGERFVGMFRQVAESEKVPLVPFLLEGIGERIELFQSDRIHPTEAAQPQMLDNVWPQLRKLL